jgi:hypothetical protein
LTHEVSELRDLLVDLRRGKRKRVDGKRRGTRKEGRKENGKRDGRRMLTP